MIIQRTENAQWLSNAYLITEGDTGVLVDANEATEPLTERVEREGLQISHILVTHHHWDHVAGIERLRELTGAPILGSRVAADNLDDGVIDTVIDHDDVVDTGAFEIRALRTDGHIGGHLSLLVDETDCLTADVLFRGTTGGCAGPGATGFDDLRSSIMDTLMALPGATRIHPGHREPSTIGAEWESNPFIRVWRGLDEEGTERCTVGGGDDAREATLVLWAPDYDGGNKAWVRFDDGTEVVTGGSQVSR